MTGRLRRLALIALVPTAIDVALLVVLRQVLGWWLVAADGVAIAVASVLSYVLHRQVTFRSDPFVRWVRMPGAFAAVALAAGAVDVALLAALHEIDGLGATRSLLLAKAGALAGAVLVRLVLYRTVLLGVVRRTIGERSGRAAAPGRRRASVVIPAYQEEGAIAATLGALRAGLAAAGFGGNDVELIVVDDGSADGTADAALGAGADQVVVLPANRGKGAAVRAGMSAAGGRTVAFTDADLAYGPDQVVAAIAAVEDGWDVAVGSRRHPDATTERGAGTVRDAGSRVINLVTTAVLTSRPHDTQCGLKAFRSDVADVLFGLSRVDGFAFDIELLHLVERHELSLAEIPVRLASRDGSRVRVLRDGLLLLRDIWRIRHWSATGAYELPDGTSGPAGAPADRTSGLAGPPARVAR